MEEMFLIYRVCLCWVKRKERKGKKGKEGGEEQCIQAFVCAISRTHMHEMTDNTLDAVKRFFIAGKGIALQQAAFLAGRTGSHVRLREGL